MDLKELHEPQPKARWKDTDPDVGADCEPGLFSSDGAVSCVTRWRHVTFLAAMCTLTCAVASTGSFALKGGGGESAARMLVAHKKFGLNPDAIDAEFVRRLSPENVRGLGELLARHVGDILVGADRLFWDTPELAKAALTRIRGRHEKLSDVREGEDGPVEVRALDTENPELWGLVFGWFIYWLIRWGVEYGSLAAGSSQVFYDEVMRHSSELWLGTLPPTFQELQEYLHRQLTDSKESASPLVTAAVTAMFSVNVESPYFEMTGHPDDQQAVGWQPLAVLYLPERVLNVFPVLGEAYPAGSSVVRGIIAAGRERMLNGDVDNVTPRAVRFQSARQMTV